MKTDTVKHLEIMLNDPDCIGDVVAFLEQKCQYKWKRTIIQLGENIVSSNIYEYQDSYFLIGYSNCATVEPYHFSLVLERLDLLLAYLVNNINDLRKTPEYRKFIDPIDLNEFNKILQYFAV
jgi:hypothetical protein